MDSMGSSSLFLNLLYQNLTQGRYDQTENAREGRDEDAVWVPGPGLRHLDPNLFRFEKQRPGKEDEISKCDKKRLPS
jgi:hypothetical protein